MKTQRVDLTTNNPLGLGGLYDEVIVDCVTGAIAVIDRTKDASVDSIRSVPVEPSQDGFVTISNASGDGTNYVFGQQIIDLADYSAISILPRVTSAGTVAASVFWKVQWSTDGTNWIDDWMPETWTAAGTPAAGERQAPTTDAYNTRQFTVAAGYKNLAGATMLNQGKRARYLRIGQKMNAAVTGTETVEYHFQLL